MAKRKSPTSKSRKVPAPLAMLMEDHQKVRKLFKQFEKLNGEESEKHAIAEKICQELKVHAQLEEELFYPMLRDALEESELIDEAEVEHQVAKQLIQQIEQSGSENPQFDALVTVLGEYINHHVEEEENEIFKQVKKADVDFEQLAQDMTQRKQELIQRFEADSDEATTRKGARDEESKRPRSRASHRA